MRQPLCEHAWPRPRRAEQPCPPPASRSQFNVPRCRRSVSDGFALDTQRCLHRLSLVVLIRLNWHVAAPHGRRMRLTQRVGRQGKADEATAVVGLLCMRCSR